MRMLTWKGWAVTIMVGVLSALLTMLVVFQVRHWLVDEEQLHQIVGLIQQGRIQVAPPPQVAPAATPKKE